MKNKNKSTATITLTKNPVGRPRAAVNFPDKKSFTRKELYNRNRSLVPLTCINYLTEAVKNGIITRLAEKRMSGKPGKPQYRYIKTELLASTPVNFIEPTPAIDIPIVVAEVSPVESSTPIEADPVLA